MLLREVAKIYSKNQAIPGWKNSCFHKFWKIFIAPSYTGLKDYIIKISAEADIFICPHACTLGTVYIIDGF